MFKKIVMIPLFLITFANSIEVPTSVESIMGVTQEKKEDIKNDRKVYSELISKLSESYDSEYSLYLATIYLNGISEKDDEGKIVEQDIKKSIKYFEKSINLNNFKSSAMLGSLYLFDSRFDKEENKIKKAKYYLNLAFKNGIYEASTALSSIYFYYEKNTKKGMEILYSGVDHNNSGAQLTLAVLYASGSKELKVSKNILLADSFLEKACLNKKKIKKVEKFCSSDKVLNYKKNEVNKK